MPRTIKLLQQYKLNFILHIIIFINLLFFMCEQDLVLHNTSKKDVEYRCDGMWLLRLDQKRHCNISDFSSWIACFGGSWPGCLFIYISTLLFFFFLITKSFLNLLIIDVANFLSLNIYFKTFWQFLYIYFSKWTVDYFFQFLENSI